MPFGAHNVRLDDGSFTMPEQPLTSSRPEVRSALKVLRLVFGPDLTGKSIVDLGCLEGGFTVEFARHGMDALGIEARQNNFENCETIRRGLALPTLRFVQDDARNIKNYPEFDCVFCSGLLYHLDKPVDFLRSVAAKARRLIIVNTHYATEMLGPVFTALSEMTENEGMPGRWYAEHPPTTDSKNEEFNWSSWGNYNSFWLTRPAILQVLGDCGFNVVFEQFDLFEPDYLGSMTGGYYATNQRALFIGVKM